MITNKKLRINQKIKVYFDDEIIIGTVFNFNQYEYWIHFERNELIYDVPFNKISGHYVGNRYDGKHQINIKFETIKNGYSTKNKR